MSLFIIKTPGSKSLSNSRDELDVLRKINRHAQLGRSKPPSRRRKLHSTKPVPVGWLEEISDESEPVVPDAICRKCRLKATLSGSYVFGYRKMTACPDCLLSVQPALYKFPSRATTDPFATLPISMDTEKYSIIQYFSTRYLPAVTFYEISDIAKTNITKGCLSNEVHMYSLLAGTTARMKHVTKDSFSRPDLAEYFATRAIGLMRHYLLTCECVTQEMILDIFLLSTTEVYNKNWPAVITHRTAFKQSIAAFGGFSKLDPSICKMLWRGDLFFAAVTCTSPVLELCWDPGALESQTVMYVTLLSTSGQKLMGTGFREELRQSSNDALLEIMGDVIGFAHTMQYYWSGFTEFHQDWSWIWDRSSALMHRLLSLTELLDPGTGYGPEADEKQLVLLVEEITRLATVIWLYLGFFCGRDPPQLKLRVVVNNFNYLRLIRERLVQNVGRFVSTSAKVVDTGQLTLPRNWKLLLWVLGLAILATVDKEEEAWLSRHFISVSRCAGVSTYDDFESQISSQYLWLRQEACDRQLTKLYDNLGAQE
jgi:hypothetical protein